MDATTARDHAEKFFGLAFPAGGWRRDNASSEGWQDALLARIIAAGEAEPLYATGYVDYESGDPSGEVTLITADRVVTATFTAPESRTLDATVRAVPRNAATGMFVGDVGDLPERTGEWPTRAKVTLQLKDGRELQLPHPRAPYRTREQKAALASLLATLI